MSDSWLLIQSGRCEPAWNMALDEALMEHSSRLGRAMLRFYGWTEPAATFGYSQKFADIAKATLLRPLIRRPTGGGLVPHDADWTYSLVSPPGHFWYHLKAEQSYCRIHEWIQAAFAKLEVPTTLAPKSQKDIPGQCFRGAEKHDLLWHGRKIAGAAQRRSKMGLLIQGSIQPPPIRLARAHWEQAMCGVAVECSQANWSVFDVGSDAVLRDRAMELASARYSQAAFNEKR